MKRGSRGQAARRVGFLLGLVLLAASAPSPPARAEPTDVSISLPPGHPAYRELRLAANLGLLAGPLRGSDPITQAEAFRLLSPLADGITRETGMRPVPVDPGRGVTPAVARRLTRVRDSIVPWEMFWEDDLYPTDFGFDLRQRVELTGSDVGDGLFAPRYLHEGAHRAEGLQVEVDSEAFLEGEWLSLYLRGRTRADRSAFTWRPLGLYLRGGWRNLRLTLGREPLAWGPAVHGGLILSTNARPLDQLRLENEFPFRLPGPLRHLGSLTASALVAKLDDPSRDDAISPWLAGARVTVAPVRWLVLGASRMTMLGGEGSGYDLTWDSFRDLALMRRANEDLDAIDDTDHRAGVDWSLYLWPVFRHLPLVDGGRFYGEYAGEDSPQEGPLPSSPGTTYGMELVVAGITLRGEASNVTDDRNRWYMHRLYTDGYTYRGRVMGHPMGGDARSQAYDLEVPLGDWGFATATMERQEHGFDADPGLFPSESEPPIAYGAQDIFTLAVERDLGSYPGFLRVEARALRTFGDAARLGPLEDWGVSVIWRR